MIGRDSVNIGSTGRSPRRMSTVMSRKGNEGGKELPEQRIMDNAFLGEEGWLIYMRVGRD